MNRTMMPLYKATYQGESVRGFEIEIAHKGKTLRYNPLNGREAISAMEELKQRGFDPVAVTETMGTDECLTLEEMKETVLMPDGWTANKELLI